MTRENFAGYCRESRFYSIRFEYVRAERAGNRRLREREFTLLSGLMARISLCRGLCECKLEESGREWKGSVNGGMGQSVVQRRHQSTVNRFGLQNCCPSEFATPRMVQPEILSLHPLSPSYAGIMLINTTKSTFDARWFARFATS